MEKYELVFIPVPGMGHLVPTVQMANLLLSRDPRLAITVLILKIPHDAVTANYIDSLSSNASIKFVVLPQQPPPPHHTPKSLMLKAIVETYKSSVRDAVTHLADSRGAPGSPRLAGFVIDMFCTTMIDVAKEFEVPCYVFFVFSASFLALHFHLQRLYDQNHNNDAVDRLLNSNSGLTVPGFSNLVPARVIPRLFHDKDSSVWLYENAKRFRSDIKGILINTFAELESRAMNEISSALASQVPPLYAVGPVLDSKSSGAAVSSAKGDDVMKWLDDQPPSSVVFLCFGSMGSFGDDQVKEIACALERSGVRFLWCLRRPPQEGKCEAPNDYANTEDVFPEGFLERTAGVGKVIGWASQMEILSHPATGGFVSHCGWNSTLESLWRGVPIGTWPMYAEQQLNAFGMVVEMGLAVEITLDYRMDPYGIEKPNSIVRAEEIEKGIRNLMEGSHEMRKKLKSISGEQEECYRWRIFFHVTGPFY